MPERHLIPRAEPAAATSPRRAATPWPAWPAPNGAPDASGQPTVVCLTSDGVLLRATSGNHVLVEATAVSYGAMDPALFDPPAGFKRLSPGDK